MAEEAKIIEYTKTVTTGMKELPEDGVSFFDMHFRRVKRLKMNAEESERVGIIDINKYPLDILKRKAMSSYRNLNNGSLAEKVLLAKRRFNAAFPTYYEISPEYEHPFSEFMKRKKYRSPFKKVTKEQISFIQNLFKNENTIHLPIDIKRLMLLEAFPENPLSRSTVHNIQNKCLRYSFKRITKYRPRNFNNRKQKLKRLFFIKTYFEKL